MAASPLLSPQWPSRSVLSSKAIKALIAVSLFLAACYFLPFPSEYTRLRPATFRVPPKKSPYAFATFLSGNPRANATEDTSDIYFTAARVLTYQFLHHPPTRSTQNIPFLVVVTGDVSESKRDRLRKDGATVVPVEKLTADWLKPGDIRWNEVMTKMRLWEMTQYEKMVLLDVDSMLLKPLDGVFQDEATNPQTTLNVIQEDNPGIGPPPPTYVFAATTEKVNKQHPYPPGPFHYLNGGFLVFRPSIEIFNYYSSLLRTPDSFDSTFPEQNLLNFAHRDDGNMPWKRLHYQWNTNFPTMEDVKGGVASVHDKFWEVRGWEPIEPELQQTWWNVKYMMDGFYQGRDGLEAGGVEVRM